MRKNRSILITGATGFVGANLTRYFLKLGFDVHAFMRNNSDVWRIKSILNNIRTYGIDLTDAGTVRRSVLKIKPAYIIHTAAYGGYFFQNETQKIISVNFLGTVNLINACRDFDFKLFVNTGSSSEYGIKSFPMKESDTLEPVTDYGVSKAAATLYVHALAKKENRPVVTLRLFSPYGYYEGASRLIPSVIKAYLKGEAPEVSSPGCVRDFVFIEDVLSAYSKAIKNIGSAAGEIINIGSGRQYSVSDITRVAARLATTKAKPKWGSMENPRYEPKHWQADIAKAKKLLGWKPEFSLEQGLKKTIKWYESL
ncbi:MAG: SDR family NAD(P)-dependent oxidoreductase [Candidatus Omnitrophica bacterium]|nr:SDR family NAD(P)-dependent oxidoreductase [Candidatus Omnitrophota bacterium]